jgi:hypothetical protein
MSIEQLVSPPGRGEVDRRRSSLLPQLRLGLASIVSLAALAVSSALMPQETYAASARTIPAPEGFLQGHLRLMSQSQYYNTLTGIFGADVLPKLSFAPFERTDGLLAIGASYDGITASQVEQYQSAAEFISALVVSPAHREFLIPCKPANDTGADNACATRYISYVGPLLFRRPLTQVELQEFVAQAAQGADRLHDFYAGLAVVLEGMLANPKFLYIKEVTEPDPTKPGEVRLNAYSLAARLSFFLWDQAPNDALLNAAANGDFYKPKVRSRIVDAMLASEKLETGVRAFFDDMLGFDDFANLAKDPKIYPAFTGEASEEAREQTLRLIIDQLLTRNGDYRDLFTTRNTFIAPSLAAIYELPSNTSWTPYTVPPDSPRVGLLTQISFLALHSHPGRSSPTERGKALRELLLCEPVPRPPPNVDFSKVENPDPSLKTMRERLTVHRTNPVCAGCHRITDPLGLALEQFDGSGEYRATENGAPIDTSGTFDGKEFKDAAGLGQVLHDDPNVPACLVKRVLGYGVGGRLRQKDASLLEYFKGRFAADGYRLPALLREVALSAAFSDVDTSEDAPVTPVKTASADTTVGANK